MNALKISASILEPNSKIKLEINHKMNGSKLIYFSNIKVKMKNLLFIFSIIIIEMIN